MNQLSTWHRKLIYLAVAGLLSIPIFRLGSPGSGNAAESNAGTLARLRQSHDLSEGSLGKVDLGSSAMNLGLLGMRGLAATVLHLNAMEQQERKEWARLRNTVEGITLLQPHYTQIWRFQGWNLAFNVSREWDQVADRFYWVKEGIKFLKQGTVRNQTETMLFHNVGDFMGRKFGNSDERNFFRRFFVDDPDESIEGPDPELNPDGRDNYLVARDWFLTANEMDLVHRIKGMTHIFARQGPVRALFDYAAARQRDGVFDTEGRAAWDDAYKEWTDVYGRHEFLSSLESIVFRLNSTAEDIQSDALANGVTESVQKDVIDRSQKMVHYSFWQKHADFERDPLTLAAHRAFNDAANAYVRGETQDDLQGDNVVKSPAERGFREFLVQFERALQKYPDMEVHEDYIDQVLMAFLYLERIHQLNVRDLPPPNEWPLGEMFVINAERLPDVRRQVYFDARDRRARLQREGQ